jgi:hypothetical protein
MSIVRDNLMTRVGYTPYCGNDPHFDDYKCPGSWPRTVFNGKQFRCPSCGHTSEFDQEFIAEYKTKWEL